MAARLTDKQNISVEYKPIVELKPYERNPRKNDQAVDFVANSIREFGFKVPIVIDRDGVIVAGHTRYKAAKKIGLEAVPCIVADDLTPEQVKAFRLVDNKVSEIAEWDFDLLNLELEDIDLDMSDFGFDMELFGFMNQQMPGVDELDAEKTENDKTVARLVFDSYKDYALHEIEIKEFAEGIGASVTVGK